METTEARRRRVGTVLGWIAGLVLGILLDYGGYALWGDAYPKGYSTFALVASLALLGTWVADKLGERAVKVLSLAVGVLVAVALLVFLVPLGS